MSKDLHGVGPDKLTASEAVYGLLGWLTTLSEPITFSATHEAGPAADIAKQFCEVNGLTQPRAGWELNLIHPDGECSGPAS